MANYTPNLNLRKPLTTEKYDVVADLNDTKDKIDNHAGAVNAQLAQKANQSDLDTTDNRIDNLIATAGDGTVPSELTDIRVGADAVTYPTAGAAVRDQFSAVNAQLADITQGNTAVPIRILGKNLFDKSRAVLDKYVNSGSGALVNSTSYNATDFIEVLPSTTYTATVIYHGAYYDKDKIYISGISGKPFTTPVNAKYIRLSLAKADMDIYQVEKGTSVSFYEPYNYKLNPDDVPDLLEKSVEPKMTTFIEIGKNKFNKADVTVGKYVNSGNGALANNVSYSASGFIEIDPSTQYISTGAYYLAFYDKDYAYISGLSVGYTQPLLTPTNAKYVRLSVPNNLLDSFQFEKGTTRTDYQQFGYVIKNGLYAPLTSASDFQVKVVLPPTINSIVGKEVNIYFDNIMNDKAEKYDIDVVCSIGKQQNDRWTCVPDSAGNYPITIKVYKDTALIAETSASIIVKSDSVGTGIEKKILIIGDSTTANGITVAELNNLFASDVMDINLIGTQGTSPNLHEGRSGWTTENYYAGATSPFVFNGLFDFGQYLAVNSLPVPDAVIINLGINDVFNFVDDASVLSKVATMLSQYNAIISNIKTVNTSVKIGLAVTIPPNYYQDGFGADYGNGQTRWRYKRNNFLWIDALIEEFAGQELSGIYLISTNVNLDTKNNFGKITEAVNSRNTTDVIRSAPNSGVHPVTSGYNQIADVYYYWLKSLEV